MTKDGKALTLTLQTKARALVVRVGPQAKLLPRSAEAEVEGLVSNDFAIVFARRVARTWVAYRVEYDVQPIAVVPPTIMVTGVVIRVNPNGRSFTMMLDSGDLRFVTMNKQTKFQLDGQLVDGSGLVTKDEAVQVAMRRTNHGWLALDVNVKSSPLRE